MVDAARLTRRVGAVVTRFAARQRFRSAEHVAARRKPAERLAPPWPRDDAAMLGEWIGLGAHVERLAPGEISVDGLAWIEDAAAERIHQAVHARSTS